nr:hypothetical protein [uncultured Rhodopila sp.]
MAHHLAFWTAGDISFDIVYDETDHPIVTLRVITPAGPIRFMAEPVMRGETMVLNGLHVQDLKANVVGGGQPGGDCPGGDGRDGPQWHFH